MKFKHSDMLVYIAIGDAYCLATEYIKLPKYKKLQYDALELKTYLKHPTHNNNAGTYSDDCQMSIGVAEVLIDGPPYTKLSFANAWVRNFKRDPRDAYSRGFQKLLQRINTGQDLLEKIKPISNKNGAAMRPVPLGVLKTPQEVLEVAKLQASITHNTPSGIFASQAVALMSYFSLHEDAPLDRDHLLSFLTSHLNASKIFKEPWSGRVKGPEVGVNTAWAVFELITSCRALSDIIRQTITLGVIQTRLDV